MIHQNITISISFLDTPMTNQGTAPTSSVSGQASYNPVPTASPIQTSGYGKYPAPPGQAVKYITSSYPTSSSKQNYPTKPSQSKYPVPPTQSVYSPQPLPGADSQIHVQPSGGEAYLKRQEPYNPSYKVGSSSKHDYKFIKDYKSKKHRYHGNISSAKVIP